MNIKQRLVFSEETFHSTLPGKRKQILLKTQYVLNETVIFASRQSTATYWTGDDISVRRHQHSQKNQIMHHVISGHFQHLNRGTSAGIQVQQRSCTSLLQPYTRCQNITNFRCLRSGVRNEIYIPLVNVILQKGNYVKASRCFQHRTV